MSGDRGRSNGNNLHRSACKWVLGLTEERKNLYVAPKVTWEMDREYSACVSPESPDSRAQAEAACKTLGNIKA